MRSSCWGDGTRPQPNLRSRWNTTRPTPTRTAPSPGSSPTGRQRPGHPPLPGGAREESAGRRRAPGPGDRARGRGRVRRRLGTRGVGREARRPTFPELPADARVRLSAAALTSISQRHGPKRTPRNRNLLTRKAVTREARVLTDLTAYRIGNTGFWLVAVKEQVSQVRHHPDDAVGQGAPTGRTGPTSGQLL